MQTLDYQTPQTSNGNHIAGGGYAILGCTLSMVSVLVLQIYVFWLYFDNSVSAPNGHSWHRTYFVACVPASIILLFAWGITSMLLRRRPRIRLVTILSLSFNVGAAVIFVLTYFS